MLFSKGIGLGFNTLKNAAEQRGMLFSKGIGLGFNTLKNAPEGRGIKPSPRIKLPVSQP